MDQTAHTFGKGYWERHWEQVHDAAPGGLGAGSPNPYLAQETDGLTPGTALDAGCGTGAEAIWLASRGWKVTGADISAAALTHAAASAAKQTVATGVTWVEADLTIWEPGGLFDLVTTNYAHPAMPQLAFYRRIADWVAPGGTLLIVGHLHDPSSPGHGNLPPAEATVTLADITRGLNPAMWSLDCARVQTRTVDGPGGHGASLRDVVVRATRQ